LKALSESSFVAPKLYWALTDKDKVVVKASGAGANLTLAQFQTLYNQMSVTYKKEKWFRDAVKVLSVLKTLN
jgi:hypothetical protein